MLETVHVLAAFTGLHPLEVLMALAVAVPFLLFGVRVYGHWQE